MIAMPHIVFCPACKYSYVRGLEGEARLHATFHARYMRPRRPKPELAAWRLMPATCASMR
jgi:zinc-finger of acetyl-transferase ESCO